MENPFHRVRYVWFDGRVLDKRRARVSLFTHSLHYGDAPFEGVRFYSTADGPAVFRWKEHITRLAHSMKAFGVRLPYSYDNLLEGLRAVVRKNKLQEGYIRPLIFFGDTTLGLRPPHELHTAILVWPWGKYHSKPVLSIGVARTRRLHPSSIDAASKISGYYVNSIFAYAETNAKGYDEALLLDYAGRIAEGPGENVFIIKNRGIYTPPLGSILPGITRRTVMALARGSGYAVKEKAFTLKDMRRADEAFFTGTAVEIVGIGRVNGKRIGSGKEGPITRELRELYGNVIHGEVKKYHRWLEFL